MLHSFRASYYALFHYPLGVVLLISTWVAQKSGVSTVESMQVGHFPIFDKRSTDRSIACVIWNEGR